MACGHSLYDFVMRMLCIPSWRMSRLGTSLQDLGDDVSCREGTDRACQVQHCPERIVKIMNLYIVQSDKHKYLHNKFIKARQTKVSGRSVFRCRITQNPIKQLLKAIDMGFLSDYCKVVLTEKDYGELF